MITRNCGRAALAALVFALGSLSQAADLFVEWSPSRGPGTYIDAAEQAVRNANQRLAELSESRLALMPNRPTFSQPIRVILTQNGQALPVNRIASGRSGSGDITLQFDSSGSRAFPTDYQNQLIGTYSASKSAMDAVFGPAAVGGIVKVLNYDADIPARQAVAGGIYIPNAPNGPEIHFPVYLSATSAGVNFIHTLLLAYTGTNSYPFDAFNEGFVRAATMKVARVPGAIPNSTSGEVEQTLDSLYDASAVYHWSNYPGLGAPTFIAANLLNDPLPIGGSTGGIYLLRYKMAGTAWAKLLVQYPGFIAAFNDYYQRNPGAYTSESDFAGLGQGLLNLLNGNPGATVEGLSFAEWMQRQAILDLNLNPGLKLVPEAFPIAGAAATNDFGVFGIVLNVFKTSPTGSETLLSGLSYPIYWRNDFTRFFTTAQDDQIPIAGGYGSVVPNFLADESANTIYRVAVDLPYQGKNVRLYLPAGAYSTGSNPTPKNVYGTVVGYDGSSASLQVRLTWPGGVAAFPVVKGAFSGTISDPNFALEQSVQVDLQNIGTSAIVASTVVNKGRGDFSVDFRSPGSFRIFSTNVSGALQSFSIPYEPLRPNPARIFGLADNQMLIGRWNAFIGGYQFYPDDGEVGQGLGYFVRPPAATPLSVPGRTSEDTPLAVSLTPGWNLVSAPVDSTVTTANILVTTTSQAVSTWAEAAGSLVGATFFKFTPDPVNPDRGTLVPATSFEPGQAYFVRSLSNDGAVLVFGAGSRGRVASPAAPTGYPVPGAWRSRFEVTSALGHYSVVELAQSPGTSRGYDREDQPLPLGPGGFQAQLLNGESLYRDVRPPKNMEVYTLSLTGLTPGVRYWIKNVPALGQKSFSLYIRGGSTMVSPGGQTSFVASSTAETIQVVNR